MVYSLMGLTGLVRQSRVLCKFGTLVQLCHDWEQAARQLGPEKISIVAIVFF